MMPGCGRKGLVEPAERWAGFEPRGILRDHKTDVMVMAPGPPNTFFSADEGGTIAAWLEADS
jgi:hypothetical protein